MRVRMCGRQFRVLDADPITGTTAAELLKQRSNVQIYSAPPSNVPEELSQAEIVADCWRRMGGQFGQENL